MTDKDQRLTDTKPNAATGEPEKNEAGHHIGSEDNTVASLPLAGQVASTLRDMIVQDKLKPGMRIRERQLSEQLNVSRTPLREAIRILVSEKLVESLPNRGAIVADPDPRRVQELLQVLGALEALGGQLAAENATDDEISEIRALHFEMLAAFHRKDKLTYFKLNQAIHKGIIAASGNDVLVDTHAQLNARLYRIRYISNQRNELWHEAVEEHEKIVAALEARDSDLIKDLLTRHLGRTWVKVQETESARTAAD